jgi:nucleotide-binding universal stress UspA family protein
MAPGGTEKRVLVGYDGSVPAGAAIEAAAALLPHARASIVNLWGPPYVSDALHRRLWTGMGGLDGFVEALEREGAAEAARLAGAGAALARAAGWTAEPSTERTYGGEGLRFGLLAQKLEPDVAVVGSRGLGGVRAFLDSVSDLVVHYAACPVLVVPYPLLTSERAALAAGPVVVGWDGSAGARRALDAAAALFAGRSLLAVSVHDGAEPPPPPARYEHVRAPMRRGHLEFGRAVAEALAGTAASRRAAAVVVGSRGRSAPREILLGSVAMAVVHHTFRPVLVVPHAGRPAAAEVAAAEVEET